MTTRVNGSVAHGYENVREAFAAAQAHDEGQAQLAVYRHGELVVDLWTGEENRIGILMSCTKGIVATCAQMLVERGLLDVDEPVTRYWPEFTAKAVTVRHLLTHTAGLPSFPKESGLVAADALDWETCIKALGAAMPAWEPGSACAYHAMSYGYLVGEVVRRVAGRSVGEFFRTEVGEPLELDLWIGLPEEQEHRVVPQFSTAPDLEIPSLKLSTRAVRSLIRGYAFAGECVPLLNTREGRAAEIPSMNAVGDAHSLARMYAATIGEVDGVRLLSEESARRARTPQTDSLSAPAPLNLMRMPFPQRFGLGYELARPGEPMLGSTSFGHSGAGGRLAFADPESGHAVGYTCSNMTWNPMAGADPRWLPWTAALTQVRTPENL
ncbi:beta-lactamase family protein [Allokutzneria sp. A3M-2-11 16]|uniref:serine hydrolase domain-containing protein n=1 Tax=Allokutzneria sp. A3M-2-11 16 TaxID=2962043 RepID=UPI0020B6D452|nr:serine hydrolase domain-containing protein [Allokutzneria sp. A3M-2-11 16]MCP3803810.1 beta-lactamase family protein [Allokutzneria sp. A3M-2-11 16]